MHIPGVNSSMVNVIPKKKRSLCNVNNKNVDTLTAFIFSLTAQAIGLLIRCLSIVLTKSGVTLYVMPNFHNLINLQTVNQFNQFTNQFKPYPIFFSLNILLQREMHDISEVKRVVNANSS